MTIKGVKFPTKNVAALSATVEEIPRSKSLERTAAQLLIGDSRANADFTFVSEGDGQNGDGQCVRNLVITRSCLNICEHVDQAKPKGRERNCCFAGTMALMLLMLAAMLAITALVDYNQLVKLYHHSCEILIENASWSQSWYIWIVTMLKDFKGFLLSGL